MKILKSLAIIIFASAMLIACGGSGGSDPKSVAESFTKAQMNFDWDGAKKCCTKESAAAIEEGRKTVEAFADNELEAAKELAKNTKMEVSEAKISEDGNAATVDVKRTMMGQESSMIIDLVKEDGNWKVSL